MSVSRLAINMDRNGNLEDIIRSLMADGSKKRLFVGHQIPDSLEERKQMMRALMNVWEPKAISIDFLTKQDIELQLQCEDKGIVIPDKKGEVLWQGDITRLKVDAIVNAANAQALGCWLPLHACIDNCIHSAAGIQLRKECNDVMQGRLLATGNAFMTKGYNLPAKYVIHTVGPIISNGIPTLDQERQLSSCYQACLDIAEKANCESIAFCCISTGVFRFPNTRAAEIAVETVRGYPRQSLKTIVFNVFLDKDYAIYQRLLR